MDAEPAGGLAQALDATGQLALSHPRRAVAQSHPLPDWTVRDLVRHIVTGNRMFAGILRGDRRERLRAVRPQVPAARP